MKEKRPNKGDRVVLRVKYPANATLANKQITKECVATWNEPPDDVFPLSSMFGLFITHWMPLQG